MLLKKYAINNTIVAILISFNYIDEAINFYLSSIKRLNITNFIFISLDYRSYNQMKKFTIHVAMYSIIDYIFNNTYFGTKNFEIVTMKKTYILLLLIKKKYNVFISDVDIHYFINPLSYFHSYNTDIVSSTDKKNEMNTGLLY